MICIYLVFFDDLRVEAAVATFAGFAFTCAMEAVIFDYLSSNVVANRTRSIKTFAWAPLI